jgi:hypothetical protein
MKTHIKPTLSIDSVKNGTRSKGKIVIVLLVRVMKGEKYFSMSITQLAPEFSVQILKILLVT